MQIGYIGLGKMGKNMVLRLLEKDYEVLVWNRSKEPMEEVEKLGAIPTSSIENLVDKLETPRLIWLMLPAGKVTQDLINNLEDLVSKGDIIIDGANSFYKDSIKRAKKLNKKGIEFVDVGVSGGPIGARNGACLMIGGKKKIFRKLEPFFQDLAARKAYQFFNGLGAGHFVKMVHNGIEYGMMQSIAEGFTILKESPFKIDLVKAARIYNHRSVIDSRLIDWLETAFRQQGQLLKGISGKVGHSGEGKWTVDTAKELNLKVPVIETSFKFRIKSDKNPSFTGRILSALRNQFGGHEVSEE